MIIEWPVKFRIAPNFLSFREKVTLAYPDGVVTRDMCDLLFYIIVPGNLNNAF